MGTFAASGRSKTFLSFWADLPSGLQELRQIQAELEDDAVEEYRRILKDAAPVTPKTKDKEPTTSPGKAPADSTSPGKEPAKTPPADVAAAGPSSVQSDAQATAVQVLGPWLAFLHHQHMTNHGLTWPCTTVPRPATLIFPQMPGNAAHC